MISIDIDVVRTKIEELEDNSPSSQPINQRNIIAQARPSISHPPQQILQIPPSNPKIQPLRPTPILSQVLVEAPIQSRDFSKISIRINNFVQPK